MPEFLITDLLTLRETWVSAPSVTDALIAHENAKRRANGGMLVSLKSRASHYSRGDVLDVSLATSACYGRRENVIRP